MINLKAMGEEIRKYIILNIINPALKSLGKDIKELEGTQAAIVSTRLMVYIEKKYIELMNKITRNKKLATDKKRLLDYVRFELYSDVKKYSENVVDLDLNKVELTEDTQKVIEETLRLLREDLRKQIDFILTNANNE